MSAKEYFMTALELVSALKDHGLTQAQIGERAKVPQSTISKIERGEVKDVMASTYLKLQALHNEVTTDKASA
jgi:transcriptional regulator with XRE-family HTH domain